MSSDISFSRLERLRRTLNEFIPEEDLKILVKTDMNKPKADFRQNDIQYDKVLVDVPCTNDRHSLFQVDNNIFARPRQEERNDMPRIQQDLLM